MHGAPASEILIRPIFWLIAVALVARAAIIVYQWRSGRTEGGRRYVHRWSRQPRWFTSRLSAVLLGVAFIGLGTLATVEAYQWHISQGSAMQQKMLPLDLHIPHVSPERTYTVVAKFRVQGKPYVSRNPLHIKFGPQKPVYRVVLYYDTKNPARNTWTRFENPSKQELNRAMIHAIGSMIVAILLLEWLNAWRTRRISAAKNDSRSTVA